jgi:Xaa-Pro aminopeptidase
MLSDLEEKINQVKTKIKTEAADACFLCSNISKTWLIPKLGTMDNVFILVTNGKNYLFGDTRDIKTLRTYGEFVVICIQTYEDVIAIVKKEKICTLLVEGDITMFEYEKYVKTLKIANIITIDTKKIRAIKTSNEIKILQKSANIICETIDYIKKNIKVGMSEKTVADMIKLHVIQEGASDISFSSIVSFGKNTADIHHFPSATCKLKQHDVIMLDIGCIYQGYCSDITRCFWLSKPDTAALEIYNLVLAAQKKAIAAIKPGVKACEIDAICRNHFTSIAPQ